MYSKDYFMKELRTVDWTRLGVEEELTCRYRLGLLMELFTKDESTNS